GTFHEDDPPEDGRAVRRREPTRRSWMSESNVVTRWASLEPWLRSCLRIVAAFMFALAGSTKLFGFTMPAKNGIPFMSQIWIGAVLEVTGGVLLLLGLF